MMENYLNYIGSKDRIYSQIKPLIEKAHKPTLIDLFSGSGTVSFNALNDGIVKSVILNDKNKALQELQENIPDPEDVKKVVAEYKLSKTNKEGYLALRNYYNSGHKSPLILYTLICYSFNNLMRFNRKGEFNAPFGMREFNSSLEEKLREVRDFVNENKDNIEFVCGDFTDFTVVCEDCVYYADPPYLASDNTGYNGWTDYDEVLLYDHLCSIDIYGGKFILSNVLENNGRKNTILANAIKAKDWIVHEVDVNYENSSYHRKNAGTTREVLVTNF